MPQKVSKAPPARLRPSHVEQQNPLDRAPQCLPSQHARASPSSLVLHARRQRRRRRRQRTAELASTVPSEHVPRQVGAGERREQQRRNNQARRSKMDKNHQPQRWCAARRAHTDSGAPAILARRRVADSPRALALRGPQQSPSSDVEESSQWTSGYRGSRGGGSLLRVLPQSNPKLRLLARRSCRAVAARAGSLPCSILGEASHPLTSRRRRNRDQGKRAHHERARVTSRATRGGKLWRRVRRGVRLAQGLGHETKPRGQGRGSLPLACGSWG
mmetsp:Transcript_18411/g.51896  ORF Transcript_18411/g.51896 Transcript_18411/m.51896 type:complete len:273 (+) Transcript_18411:902-1720(+)